MYKLTYVLLCWFTFTFAANVLALDEQQQHVLQASESLQLALSARVVADSTAKIRPKSTSNVIFEAYTVDSNNGSKATYTGAFPGPVTIDHIRGVSQTLYEEPGYGVYRFAYLNQSAKAQVWYAGNLASVIVVIVDPSNSPSGGTTGNCCKR
jgi:hypothetical protein